MTVEGWELRPVCAFDGAIRVHPLEYTHLSNSVPHCLFLGGRKTVNNVITNNTRVKEKFAIKIPCNLKDYLKIIYLGSTIISVHNILFFLTRK